MSTPILSVQNLTKRFGPEAPPVVHEVSFEVEDRDLFDPGPERLRQDDDASLRGGL